MRRTEPEEINFLHKHWGHNLEFSGKVIDGKAQAFCWYSRGVEEGDRVLWETAYGVAVGVVTKVKRYMDPPDMYYLDLEVVERRDHEGNVLTKPPEATS